MEIRPDYSFILNINDQVEYVLDPRYDRVDVFRSLGHAVLMVISSKGVTHQPVDIPTAELVAERGIPLIERSFITESEHERYLQVQEALLDDNWLE